MFSKLSGVNRLNTPSRAPTPLILISIFMHRIRHVPKTLSQSARLTLAENAPYTVFGIAFERLQNQNVRFYPQSH